MSKKEKPSKVGDKVYGINDLSFVPEDGAIIIKIRFGDECDLKGLDGSLVGTRKMEHLTRTKRSRREA